MKSFLKRALGFAIVLAMLGAGFYYFGGNAAQKQSGGLGGGRRAKAGADDVVPVIAAQAASATSGLPRRRGLGRARTPSPCAAGRGKILRSISRRAGGQERRCTRKIDPATYQAQLDQAVAKKALDEALLANAKHDLERYAEVGTNSLTKQQIDTQRALVAQ